MRTSRTIVGWRVAAPMSTDMVFIALSMVSWSRGKRLEGLITDSDAGSQFMSVRFGERLAELGAVPPAELEAAFYAAQHSDQLVGIQ